MLDRVPGVLHLLNDVFLNNLLNAILHLLNYILIILKNKYFYVPCEQFQ